MRESDRVLDRLEMGPDFPGVYWIGRKAVRLTFISQQQRALNLLYALFDSGRITSGSKVTIVGAGLAGLTAAFAAHHLDAKVTLIEAKPVPLHLQRGCQLRFVHPYILDWPSDEANNPLSNLPCLNWGAGMAADVANTILEQWLELERSLEKVLYGYDVRQITKSADGKPVVFAEGDKSNYFEACDCLILAVGFGLEKSSVNVPFLSYWENDNFGRPIISGRTPRRYLVSGCGDGGLIDAIRLSINAFDHAEFVFLLSGITGLDMIKKQLPLIDKKTAAEVVAIQKRGLAAQDSVASNSPTDAMHNTRADTIECQFIEEAYRNLKIPQELIALITKQQRRDTIVYLNGKSSSPLLVLRLWKNNSRYEPFPQSGQPPEDTRSGTIAMHRLKA